MQSDAAKQQAISLLNRRIAEKHQRIAVLFSQGMSEKIGEDVQVECLKIECMEAMIGLIKSGT